MSNQLFVYLRDTISGATLEVSPERAKKILNHPVWGKRHVKVDTKKPEVLAAPYTVDGEGKREKIAKPSAPKTDKKEEA